jgi:hypothetical protein
MCPDRPKWTKSDYSDPVANRPETAAPTALPATATFELRQFAWLTPDRLGVSGTFGGLQKPADGAPVLVIRAGDRVLRLPAVADSLGGPPEEGRVWQAAFEWQDAPVAFDGAELELGAGLAVDLPGPDPKRRLSRKRVLEVRTAGGGGGDPRRETVGIVDGPPTDRAAESAEPPAAPGGPVEGGAASVGSQVELLAAQEEVREIRIAMQQTQQELARARDDLRAERERRSGDSERFREGLAKLRESADGALAVEHSAKRQLGSDLREAQEVVEKQDAALKTLRGQLEAAGRALTEAEAKARAEADALRKQVAKLESDGKETERLRAELERTRARADAAHTELEQARGAVDQARKDAERLLGRLTAIRAK